MQVDIDEGVMSQQIGDFDANGKLDIMQLSLNKSQFYLNKQISVSKTSKWGEELFRTPFLSKTKNRFLKLYTTDFNGDGH
ncbi:MAG: hypothetical protein Q7U47_01175 [Paludibacter sp.]|nr:hypothetical protein [Paludibacter sp.]